MRTITTFFIAIMILLPLSSRAEEGNGQPQATYDYGMRFSGKANVNLVPKKLKLGLCAELRTLDVVTEFAMFRPEIHLTYSPVKYFNMYVGGDILFKTKDITYRPEVALTGKYTVAGLTLSLKERFFGAFTPKKQDPVKVIGFLRSVPRLQYKFNNSRLSPYFYSDIYLNFNGPSKGQIPRVGYFLGTDIKINPKNKMDVKLIYETYYKQHIPSKHYFAIGIGYTFN